MKNIVKATNDDSFKPNKVKRQKKPNKAITAQCGSSPDQRFCPQAIAEPAETTAVAMYETNVRQAATEAISFVVQLSRTLYAPPFNGSARPTSA